MKAHAVSIESHDRLMIVHRLTSGVLSGSGAQGTYSLSSLSTKINKERMRQSETE